jgi:hypothetical protein
VRLNVIRIGCHARCQEYFYFRISMGSDAKPFNRMHVEAISLGCVCGIRILSKTKYLHFGSVRRVARDVGTDVIPY